MAVKEMAQQKFVVLTTYKNGVPFEDALWLVKDRGLVLISNEQADKQFASGKLKEPIWTGTIGAYAEPGRKLGKEVEYTDPETKEVWVFPVPKKWQNETNAMLKVDPSHYDIKVEGNRKTVIVDDEANISLVRDFPTENSWRKTKDGIPCGEQVDSSDPNARYLYRADRMVGPVARDFDLFLGYWRDVGLVSRPSGRLGVVAVEPTEAGEAGTPEKLAIEREDDGTMVLKGSKEQLDEVAKLIRKQNLG